MNVTENISNLNLESKKETLKNTQYVCSDTVIDEVLQNNNLQNNNQNTETNSNYTSINKLNFTNLTNEPILTYIQKDKFKLYNYNIMLDTHNLKHF